MLLESKGTQYPKSFKAASLREDSDSVQMGQGMYVRNLLIDDAVLPSNEASLTESSVRNKRKHRWYLSNVNASYAPHSHTPYSH
ncbi:hypothetical protein P910_003101 [Xylella fastidiosa Mul-MD]|nr:hypothetical protein P303_11775 [Xylella fastidiosa MUL0034]EWG13646.1 hypothetical protein P910_003101 [Xylella fastidiosa Mul-MD]